MNKQFADLKRAMAAADLEEIEHTMAVALAEENPPVLKPNEEEERERLLDAALGDAIETVNRHRLRLGRRVCSRPDATTTRKIFELLRAMAGADGGCDNDPSFQ